MKETAIVISTWAVVAAFGVSCWIAVFWIAFHVVANWK